MSYFGRKLKLIRLERKMSQEQLANLLGTTKQVVSRYENGKRVPKITIAEEFASKLCVPLDYLIDNEIENAAPNKEDGQLSVKKIKLLERLEDLPQDVLDEVDSYIDYLISKRNR